MSRKPHYCRCFSDRNNPNRVPTEWYCFVHRRFVCDNCVQDESKSQHVNCVVGKYQDYLTTPKFQWPHKCSLCSNNLPDDALSVQRLMCKCLFHWKCLREYLLFQPDNNVPCPRCSDPIEVDIKNKTKLGKSVNKFLRLVTRDRLHTKTSPTSTQPKYITSSSLKRKSKNNPIITTYGNGPTHSNETKEKSTFSSKHESHTVIMDSSSITSRHHRSNKQLSSYDKNKYSENNNESKSKLKFHKKNPNISNNNFISHLFVRPCNLKKLSILLFFTMFITLQFIMIYFLFFYQSQNNKKLGTNSNSVNSNTQINNINPQNQLLKQKILAKQNGGNFPPQNNKLLENMLGANRLRAQRLKSFQA